MFKKNFIDIQNFIQKANRIISQKKTTDKDEYIKNLESILFNFINQSDIKIADYINQLCNTIEDAIWFEENKKPIYINRAFESVFQTDKQTFTENPASLYDIMDEELRIFDEKTAEKNTKQYFEFIITPTDNEPRWIGLHKIPIEDTTPKWLYIARDITDQRLIEEGLKALNEELVVQSDEYEKMNEILCKTTEKKLRKAKKEWEDIFNAIGHPTLILDPDFSIIAVNHAVVELTGKSSEKIKHTKCYNLFHGKKLPYKKCPLLKLIENKISSTLNMEMEAFDRTFMVSCTPIFDENGKLSKIIHLATDITNAKRAENKLKDHEKQLIEQNREYENINEELRESNQKIREINLQLNENQSYLNSILKTAPIGIGVAIHHDLQFINHHLCEITGYPKEELTGSDISLLYQNKEEYARIKEIDYAEIVEKGIVTIETKWTRKDGKLIDILLSSSPVNRDNIEAGITFAASDISDRKQIENDLITAKHKAEESDKLKTAFLANMSHEIRTPMNGIMGFSNLLCNKTLSIQKKEQYVNMINSNANQLLTVIGNIIDLAKIESKQLEIAISKCNINNILQEIYEQYEKEKAEQNKENIKILLRTNLKYEQAFIETDPVRLKQILSNLLSNAMKFSYAGIIELGYSIELINDHRFIKFHVKDTGVGISKEKIKIIFERFRQEDDSHSRIFGGAGLGLSISRGLVRLLGGKIWVESEKNIGSTFYFTIPYYIL